MIIMATIIVSFHWIVKKIDGPKETFNLIIIMVIINFDQIENFYLARKTVTFIIVKIIINFIVAIIVKCSLYLIINVINLIYFIIFIISADLFSIFFACYS